MTKEEFTAYLRDRGYAAENDRGCVMVVAEKDVFPAVGKLAREAGYEGSFGWRKKVASDG